MAAIIASTQSLSSNIADIAGTDGHKVYQSEKGVRVHLEFMLQ